MTNRFFQLVDDQPIEAVGLIAIALMTVGAILMGLLAFVPVKPTPTYTRVDAPCTVINIAPPQYKGGPTYFQCLDGTVYQR